jgi:ABC-type xylose transport system permease subunit
VEGDGGLAGGIPARLTAAEGRKFAWPVGLAFGVLAGIAWWRGRHSVALVLATLSGLLLVAGLLAPTTLGPVQRGWMAMAHAISKVTTPIFLGIVYFLIFTPAGLIMRLSGRRPLERKPKNASWWLERSPEARQRYDMERQF